MAALFKHDASSETSRGVGSRVASALYWSVIPAAFIGPGTVVSCAKAGEAYGFALLWALAFSGVACAVLQETVARVAGASGRDLGPLLAVRFGRAAARGAAGAVAIGCAAYQAGNVAGAAAGLGLACGAPKSAALVIVAIGAGALLWRGASGLLATVMSLAVALMGVAFVAAAAAVEPAPGAVVRGLLVPSLPFGALATAVALVGTTVVPYNLFLGAGLARARGARPRGEARFGVSIAVGVGALISAAIVVAGTSVEGDLTFQGFADALSTRYGGWAGRALGVGLFAAGFSSAVTAPWAAAVALRAFRSGADAGVERAIRLIVLGIGVTVASLELRPTALILSVQALNGVILPIVAAFTLLAANDVAVIGRAALNGPLANVLGGGVFVVTAILAASLLARAAVTVFGAAPPEDFTLVVGAAVPATFALAWIALRARRLRLSSAVTV